MARIHGKRGQVSLTTSSPAVPLISIDAFTLNMARDFVDVTSFGDANKTYVAGLEDISGTFSGNYDRGTGSPESGGNMADLLEAAGSETPIRLKLEPDTDDPTHYFEGPAYIDLSISTSASGAVKVSGNFKASGAWTKA